MSDKDPKIEVSAQALGQLLRAATGPAHHIRELQVTMNIPFGEPNCIEVLRDQYNEYAEKQNAHQENNKPEPS